MDIKQLFIYKFKTNLNAIVRGYLTRKYKRGFPINRHCFSCSKQIKGIIHRQEEIGFNMVFTIYRSENENENRGISSVCFYPISTCTTLGTRCYCSDCSKNTDNISVECAICLEKIKNNIVTKCNHNFCFKCIMQWIETDNMNNILFKASCPICKSTI